MRKLISVQDVLYALFIAGFPLFATGLPTQTPTRATLIFFLLMFFGYLTICALVRHHRDKRLTNHIDDLTKKQASKNG